MNNNCDISKHTQKMNNTNIYPDRDSILHAPNNPYVHQYIINTASQRLYQRGHTSYDISS